MDYTQIAYRRDGTLGVVTMNRPDKLNAWTPRMAEEMAHAFRTANDDPEVAVIVLTGEGRGFCAGADLREEARILQVPTLCIACSHDKSTPPDLVRETADTIPEARFVLLRRAGHLPCIDHPEAFGAAITGFLAEIEDAPPQPPPLPPRLK